MKNKMSLFFLLITTALFAAESDFREKETALENLKQKLQDARDSLHNEIAARWNAKQKEVEQRQRDKEELQQILETQQKAITELALQKENVYSNQQRLEEQRQLLQEKKQEWSYNKTLVNDLLQKESDAVIGMFPSIMEEYRGAVEEIKSKFAKDGNIPAAVSRFWDVVSNSIGESNKIGVVKETVLPDGETSKLLSILRFGNVFGYGIGEDGSVYAINQSGRTGAHRYTIKRIENYHLEEKLVLLLPQCLKNEVQQVHIPVDILQNENSQILTTGKKETSFSKLKKFIYAGGPVMIPLLLIPVWALILIVIKTIQFAYKKLLFVKTAKKVETLLEKDDYDGVKAFVEKKKGIAARIAQKCLHNTCNGRNDAEKGVREVLINEAAILGTHLNTLAVLAAVAPLLGLLGTVTGMINLFEVITRFGTGDPKILAGGISEALITTETGLIIAIPVLLFHNYLRNRKNRIVIDLQLHALRLLNKIYGGKL